MSGETICPLCSTPRPRRAKRCICNYTFEYERPSRPSLHTAKHASPQASSVLATAIFVAGLALAYMRLQERVAIPATLGLVLAASGLFCIGGAYFSWGFFMRNSRARRLRFFVGSTGARYFYALLGGVFTGVGAGALLA